jgi:hypothetical protein
MNKFDSIANTVLRKIDKVTIKEDNEITANINKSLSFGDFMRSLTGKTIQDVLDSASFARLYSMNKHGMTSAAYDTQNPDVLMNKFLTKLSDFVNQDVMKLRSGAAQTDEFKKKHDYEGYLEREKERKDLFRQVMSEKDPEKKNQLRQKAHAFRNNSQYADARQALYNKEDKLVDEFHNSKIQPGQFVNDGSEEYEELEKMYNTLLSLRSGKVEDQEGKANANLADAEKGLQRLAATADDVMVGPIGKLMNRSARQAKKALAARSKIYLQAIPAYNKATKDMADAYKALSNPKK